MNVSGVALWHEELVAAPRHFAAAIRLAGLKRILFAFRQERKSSSWFVIVGEEITW